MTSPEAARSGSRHLRAGLILPALQDALSHQGRFTFPLRGDSMLPTLPTECEIEVVPLDGEPRLGELLVFVLDDVLIAHRLVGRSREILIAQGDNRRGPDRPVQREHVLGRITMACVDGRQIWPRRGAGVRAAVWLARYQALRGARWIWHHAR